jgi:hypothetical protein
MFDIFETVLGPVTLTCFAWNRHEQGHNNYQEEEQFITQHVFLKQNAKENYCKHFLKVKNFKIKENKYFRE